MPRRPERTADPRRRRDGRRGGNRRWTSGAGGAARAAVAGDDPLARPERRRIRARPGPRRAGAGERVPSTWRNVSAQRRYCQTWRELVGRLRGRVQWAPMRMLWRPIVDKVAPYDAGQSIEAELRTGAVIRLSANESPLGPSPSAVEAIRREAARVHLYPDGGSTELREALARRLGVGANWLVVGNGADELLGLRRHPTAIAFRTFSKIAGLAGLRIGYVIARPECIDVLNRVRAPYNVNRLAQVAALAALEDTEHLERTRAVVLAERPRLRAALAERGAPSPPS